MKITVISYSLTGNNNALAQDLAKAFVAEHIKIIEPKSRTTFTTILDVIFNRTPSVNLLQSTFENIDLIIFVAPVWIGKIASPLRAYFNYLKNKPIKYAFVSISGGADGPNSKLSVELKKRIGKEPVAIINMYVADLLPPYPKPSRSVTTAYHINETEVKSLTSKVVKYLRERIPI